MSNAAKLRALLDEGTMIVAPGAIDCLTGRLIEQAGFPAIYMTGAGTSATYGYPDYGLLTMSEMVANASRIARAVDIPVISDADTGYGNELNVFRCVEEFERSGVAAIQIEDQVFPKRCGHVDEKEVVTREDFVAKIRAASCARKSRDFLIIARTDARAVAGFEEAIIRANAALENGADIAFVEAMQGLEELSEVPKQVNGRCMLNLVRGGKTPDISVADAREMGYAMVIMPGLLIDGMVSYCDRVLEEAMRTGRQPAVDGAPSPKKFFARFGAEEWDKRRSMFREPNTPK
ncbi:isocitrate lyase/PEP mutase family protein [Caballeronia sp. LP003]|uniref:isocitrate lyase/PEP mutase family protein n=1 Tax=Caballeronia sp. LP003 TaxID=3038551 RepID=UPI002859F001|nr:isocitrate lyase/PEP mutase family protein [Caballeronia sp. LP003]MDR5785267.1 isocitrate lyase/PEP mutase family protein [Caballeronia sp. LP003]